MSDFDVIIVGTGLSESILSGSLSRHLKVLHLDVKSQYGGQGALLDSPENFVLKQYHSTPVNDDMKRSQSSSEYADEFLHSFNANIRKYTLDPTPKLLFARGDIIELMIHSGVGSFIGFELIKSLYYVENGKITKVPGSKEDIFVNEDISLVDKRRLMKFLTFAMNYPDEPSETYDGNEF